MTLEFSKHFLRSYTKAPADVQKAFDKQSRFLPEDLHHPSLRAKKYDEGRNVWQARVTRDWRFYFKIDGDVYRLERYEAIRNSSFRSVDPNTDNDSAGRTAPNTDITVYPLHNG